MDHSYPYIASLTREPFFFYEMRSTAKLMSEGLSDDAIVKEIVEQNRILKKKPETEKDLEIVYEQNDSVLRNLFSFSGSILDIKGYSGPREFTENFPFVPYQFIIMKKVFAEIRKHGNSGKHLSGGERSMLSGFQEAAQKIQEIHQKMKKPVKRFFKSFDSIFTLNYDNNIERLTNKTIYHLHGDYSVLADSENPKTVQGFLNKKNGRIDNFSKLS